MLRNQFILAIQSERISEACDSCKTARHIIVPMKYFFCLKSTLMGFRVPNIEKYRHWLTTLFSWPELLRFIFVELYQRQSLRRKPQKHWRPQNCDSGSYWKHWNFDSSASNAEFHYSFAPYYRYRWKTRWTCIQLFLMYFVLEYK